MERKKRHKLDESLSRLSQAIDFYGDKNVPGDMRYLAVSKAFEIAVEYAWKELKRRVEDEGIEAISPKEAVRQAARIGIISNAENWLNYLDLRNSGVHDYFSVEEKDLVAYASDFLKESRKVFSPSTKKKSN
jgi:nucleotidyltransferase substrate binding protein (TIGR01987 family)